MALTVDQKQFVQELANLAYGTGGKSERTAGGKGDMGLMYGPDGSVHVFKFNTRGSQAESAQRDAFAGRGNEQIVRASNALRTELEKLALSAGLGKDVITGLLGENKAGKSLLTRKIVARFVSGIAASCQEMKDVWNGVAGVKSASNMAFEKVLQPNADYAKYNRAVAGYGAGFVRALNNLENGLDSLGGDNDPYTGKLAWLGNIAGGNHAALATADYLKVRDLFVQLEERGFSFLVDGRAKESAIKGALKEIRPELSFDDIDLIAPVIRAAVNTRASRALSEEDGTTFTDVVRDCLDKTLEDAQLQAAMKVRRENKAAIAELKAALAEDPELKDEPFIADNLHILGTVNEHYDKAMRDLSYFATHNGRDARMMDELERNLHLQTKNGTPVPIHKALGSLNVVNGMKVAHGIADIYNLAKEKGKVRELLLALNEDGCFQARMMVLQDFASHMEGGEAMDVKHRPDETIEDGLINELGASVKEYMNAHNNATPTWAQIKGAFGARMRGKQFAGIAWTPHKIYVHITENVLASVMVDVDDDFKTSKADLNKVHFAEL